MEQWELSVIASGNANSTATLEDILEDSYKAKHVLTIRPSNCAPMYLHKWIENLCLHKNLHRDVYSSFIHNHHKLEATKKFFNRWVDKQTLVHSYNGILFSDNNIWAIKPQKRHESTLNAYGLVKESSFKRPSTVWF